MSDISKIITQLNAMFRETGLHEDKEIKTSKGYMDSCNIMMFVPKKERLKVVFEKTFKDEWLHDVPTLDNEHKQSSKYSVDYLKIILNLLIKSECESVRFTLADDFPLIVETDDFKVILAPRVTNDWGCWGEWMNGI